MIVMPTRFVSFPRLYHTQKAVSREIDDFRKNKAINLRKLPVSRDAERPLTKRSAIKR